MKRLLATVCLFILCSGFVSPCLSIAQSRKHEWRDRTPYGNYCSGPERGWYGARKEVKTKGEAKTILEGYFKNRNIAVGDVKERKGFFEAEIRDENNTLIDRVIVNKRTGRIRSIY